MESKRYSLDFSFQQMCLNFPMRQNTEKKIGMKTNFGNEWF